ncbi:hypothetical protein J0H58_39090 [bacterium]|nr:hypothetical protein [bacterium]
MLRIVPVALIDAVIAAYPPPEPPHRPPAAARPSPSSGGPRVGAGDNRVARCRAYLTASPGAVSGDGGHDRTFWAARVIWADFVIDEPDGYPLLQEFNRACQPMWSEKELRHKWDDAVAKGGERGKLLYADRPGYTPPGAVPPPADPADTAEGAAAAGRPRIVNNERQLRDLVADAGQALAAHNHPPVVFDRGGCMVRVRPDPVQGTVIEPLSEDAVRLTLSHAADWFHVTRGKNGEEWHADLPSPAAVAALLSMPAWPGVPYLAGVCTAPVFTADGSLLSEPGYHAPSGYLFEPDPGLAFLPVPDRPTPAEVAAAVTLLNEPIEEFPFADPASRASALCVMVEPFARELIDGPTPLRLFEAPTEGTGKTLLLQTIAVPAFGRVVDPLQEVEGVEEWRKTLFAALVEHPGMVFIDNINRKLDSGPLASCLTAVRIRQRVLGVSRTQTVPVKCLWAATGNNVRMSREMVRRTVPGRLLPDTERPYEGRAFKRKLPRWAVDNRPRLAAAALTLVRAWLAAGRPKGRKSLGMFEAWAEVMGGILDVAGIPGFLTNLDDYRRTAVDAEGEWREFATLWWARYADAPVPLGDLYDLAAGSELLGAAPDVAGGTGRYSGRGMRTRFGSALAAARDRVYAGYRIRAAGEDGHSKMKKYRLEPTPGAAPSASPAGGGVTVTEDGDTVEFVA